MKRTRRVVRRGFTLIEVMIVIAIILALSGLVGVALFQRRDEAKVDLTKTDLKSLQRGLEDFRLHFDRYPTTEESITVLWDKSQLDDPELEDKWKGYMSEALPKDRWGGEWGYEQLSRTSYKIWSFGPDGEEDTDDDIIETKRPIGSSEDDGDMLEGDFMPPPDSGG